MARVTVEDCIDKVSNRFELVMLASQRARKIGSGASLQVDRDNDKNPVVSLREIAAEKIQTSDLREELIQSNQRVVMMEDNEDVIDLMDGEEEWSSLPADADEDRHVEEPIESPLGNLAGLSDNDQDDFDDDVEEDEE